MNANDRKRFWAKVDVRGPDECWPWKAYADRYGRFYLNGKPKLAHRIAYILTYGYTDLDVLHKPVVCHNPLCCNPRHLLSGDSEENAGHRKLDGTDCNIPVIRSDGIVFDGVNDAERKTGVLHNNISKVCIGKCKSAGGYGWKYLEDSDGNPWSTVARRYKASIVCSDGRIFKSAADVEHKTGISSTHISAVCLGRRKSAGGYGWSYYTG